MVWTRRQVIGAGLSILWLPSQALAEDSLAPATQGCCLAHSDVDSVFSRSMDGASAADDEGFKMFPRSGNSDFDYALAHTLDILVEMFRVLPGFAYIDDVDDDHANAYATTEVLLNRADGTVLFGKHLLAQVLRQHPASAVAGVCAHEFAHILQYKYDLIRMFNAGQPNVRRSELHADFMTGYFAGARRKANPSFNAAEVALVLHNLGDTDFGSPDHHGTHEQRSDAVRSGYSLSYNENKSFDEALQISINYAMSIV